MERLTDWITIDRVGALAYDCEICIDQGSYEQATVVTVHQDGNLGGETLVCGPCADDAHAHYTVIYDVTHGDDARAHVAAYARARYG